MRLLLTVHQFLPEFSAGTEVITLGVARELIRRGHTVQIFTGFPGPPVPRPDDHRFDRYEFQGIVIHRFTHAFVPMGGQANVIEHEHDNHLVARFFKQVVEEFKPDLVHAFHLARLSASPMDVCLEQGIPFIFTATDFWAVCPMSQLLLPGDELCQGPTLNSANCLRHLSLIPDATPVRRMFYQLPDAVVAGVAGLIDRGWFPPTPFSPMVRALMDRPEFLSSRFNQAARIIVPSKIMAQTLERHGIDQMKMVRLPYGIDVSHIQRKKCTAKSGPLRVGYIGTIASHKGLHILFEAVRGLPADVDLKLTVHGMPGPVPGYVTQIETAARDEPRIELAGAFDHQRIGEILSAIDVLVVPSLWYENTPLVIYEAQAAGVAVVATDLGGMAEIVRHEIDGLLFPRGDVAALATALARLAGDRALACRLAAAGPVPASVPDHVAQLESIYRQVIPG